MKDPWGLIYNLCQLIQKDIDSFVIYLVFWGNFPKSSKAEFSLIADINIIHKSNCTNASKNLIDTSVKVFYFRQK